MLPSDSSVAHRALSILAVLHPFVFATAFVLDRFALTNTSVHELPRPLIVALLVAGLLLLVGWAVLRRLPSAALFASIAFLLIAFHPVQALVMLGVAAWWVTISMLRKLRGSTWPALTTRALPVRIAIGYSGVLLIVALWSTGWALLPRVESRSALPAFTSERAEPDIYVLMLDGYPRSDTLAQEFDFDNAAFESDLSELGFVTAAQSRANYTKTWLATSALLNAEYVHGLTEIVDPPGTQTAQVRLAEALINAGAVPEALRQHGYEIISIPSPIRTAGITDGAVVRQVPHLNSFEIALVTSSLPSWIFPAQVLDLLAADARAYIETQLEAFEAAARPADAARLVWAHIMAPHPPFLLGQEPGYLRECFPVCKLWETTVEETRMTSTAYQARMRSQVQELNRLVIAALTRVVNESPDATVIVLSDHGARHHIDDTEEHFRTFFAARTGSLDVAFPDDVSHVNVFRRILSAAFDAPLPDLPYQAWTSDWFLPLTLTRYR